MKRRNPVEPMVGDHENPVMDAQPTPKKPRLRRTKMLNVRVSEPMSKYLDFLASEQGTTASGIVRFLLAQAIEEFREATDFAWDEVALG
jgi:predicted DNA-binding protein